MHAKLLKRGGFMTEKFLGLKEIQRKKDTLIEKLNKLEKDLRRPMSMDFEEYAVEESDRNLLMSLYEIEKKNLTKLNQEIAQFYDHNNLGA